MKKLVRNWPIKKTGLLLAALPIFMPFNILAADDAGQSQLIEQEVLLQASFDASLIKPVVGVIKVELVESPYQARLKEIARKRQLSQQMVNAISADPGPEAKRALVKTAAQTWGIDWKVLEAVWQVESGKRWYFVGGSSAGARGPCQFMPGTWRAYAQDGNGDSVKNINDARDCLFAAAKLLAVNGAAQGDYVRALKRYNSSMSYVLKVLRIADSIEG